MKCFDLFFDRDFIDHVVQETNRYAQQYQIAEAVFFLSLSPVRSSYPATGNEMYNPQFADTDCAVIQKPTTRLSKYRVLQMPGFGDISSERDQGNVAAVPTCYWLNSLRFKPQWGQDFPHPYRTALRFTHPLVQ
jgi:hypothetical protein